MSEKRFSGGNRSIGPGRTSYRGQKKAMMARSTERLLILERRLLLGATGSTLLAFIFWIISVSTDYWFIVYGPIPITSFDNQTTTANFRSNSGLWRICRTEFRNVSLSSILEPITVCQYHQLFPTEKEVVRNPEIDKTILHYTRAETSFSIISIFLMIIGHGFSIYTFYEPRYMFKRLAGGIHFVTGATILVVVEVLISSVQYEAQHLPHRHPAGTKWDYGYSFFLACICFVAYVFAGCAFIVCSRKRKGDRAPSAMHALADEPHILGRV